MEELLSSAIHNMSSIGAQKDLMLRPLQVFGLSVSVLLIIICIVLNLIPLISRLRFGWKSLSSFDVIILNHLCVNVMVTCFVDGWDFISYMIFQSYYPFPEGFCYFSRFITMWFPFMTSWNVVLLALYQLVGLIIYRFRFPERVRSALRIVPYIGFPAFLWFAGLFHAIFTYSYWGIFYHDQYCGAISLFVWLHEGLGLFVAPACTTFILLTILFILHLVMKYPFPTETSTTFQPTTSQDVHSFFKPLDKLHQPFVLFNGDTTEDTAVLITTATSDNESTNSQLWHVTKSTIAITVAVWLGLIIFLLPYGSMTIAVDVEVRYKGNYEFMTHLWWFQLIYPWALLKGFYEPIMILLLSYKYRPRATTELCSFFAVISQLEKIGSSANNHWKRNCFYFQNISFSPYDDRNVS